MCGSQCIINCFQAFSMNCVITPWGLGIAKEAGPVLLLMDLCLTTMGGY